MGKAEGEKAGAAATTAITAALNVMGMSAPSGSSPWAGLGGAVSTLKPHRAGDKAGQARIAALLESHNSLAK
jgi:hypothetical protein